ncbi:MAG: carbamoyltransferase N-terminal domain-containing protein, partial [Bacteroidota bacterium]
MLTLGINAAYHDPAACVVRDGEVIAAAEDERFTHIKHGKRPVPFSAYQLPFYAIDYCLREADVDLSDIDHLGYSYDPFLFLNGQAKERVLTLPLQPDEHPVPEGWETPWDPLFASSIINAPRFLIDDVPH